ncbi:MAG TPA: AarF/ABC1/UbiB kinase family protein [Pseudobdellovibrionaceae bacterium]|nr:AarF/ABC1/UbiB kinase family protein [Pseudobdellovibrionaceae bacterium]
MTSRSTSTNSTHIDEQAELRSGLFMRALTLCKLGFDLARQGHGRALWKSFADPHLSSCSEAERQAQLQRLKTLAEQMSKELGALKGSAMKVGQMLSIYGEQFLPEEVNLVLKRLQCSAPSLAWSEIEPQLQQELGESLKQLSVDQQPRACASIGQVHRAHELASGRQLALKVQYPQMDRAVRADLKVLKVLIGMARALGQAPNLNHLIDEVEALLAQELDYLQEAEHAERFHEQIQLNPRLKNSFVVPHVHRQFTTSRVLCMDWVDGERFDSMAIAELPEARRTDLAHALIELYLFELFDFGRLQTDAHIGNFRVILKTQPHETDRIALFDFGATRELGPEFMKSYKRMVKGALYEQREEVLAGGLACGFLREDDPPLVRDEFFKLCQLVLEPFRGGDRPAVSNEPANEPYDWKSSDLPQRLADQLAAVIAAREFRLPPTEVIFIDRKASGLYALLSTLGARTQARPLLERALSEPSRE